MEKPELRAFLWASLRMCWRPAQVISASRESCDVRESELWHGLNVGMVAEEGNRTAYALHSMFGLQATRVVNCRTVPHLAEGKAGCLSWRSSCCLLSIKAADDDTLVERLKADRHIKDSCGQSGTMKMTMHTRSVSSLHTKLPFGPECTGLDLFPL